MLEYPCNFCLLIICSSLKKVASAFPVKNNRCVFLNMVCPRTFGLLHYHYVNFSRLTKWRPHRLDCFFCWQVFLLRLTEYLWWLSVWNHYYLEYNFYNVVVIDRTKGCSLRSFDEGLLVSNHLLSEWRRAHTVNNNSVLSLDPVLITHSDVALAWTFCVWISNLFHFSSLVFSNFVLVADCGF